MQGCRHSVRTSGRPGDDIARGGDSITHQCFDGPGRFFDSELIRHIAIGDRTNIVESLLEHLTCGLRVEEFCKNAGSLDVRAERLEALDFSSEAGGTAELEYQSSASKGFRRAAMLDENNAGVTLTLGELASPDENSSKTERATQVASRAVKAATI